MNFGQALELLKQDHKIARTGWNGKGMYIVMYRPPYTKTKYIYMLTATRDLVPWTASQTDILAEDWIIV